MDYQVMTDGQLAVWVRGGDPDAFAELTTRYKGLVRAKAKACIGPSAPEAEDLLPATGRLTRACRWIVWTAQASPPLWRTSMS